MAAPTPAELTAQIAAPLDALRAAETAPAPLDEEPLAPGLRFRLDAEAGQAGEWESPAGRLLSLRCAAPPRPGRWLGLHLEMPMLGDLAGVAWFGFALRAAAARPLALRPCLRSGREGGGFTDLFFNTHALARPGARDHMDMLAPPRVPDLAAPAPWREFILFLPPAEALDLSIEDLRVFVL